MKQFVRIVGAIVVAGAIASSQAAASDLHSFTASLLGGVGGSIDKDAAGFSNLSWQLGFGVQREVHTQFGMRLGRIDMSSTTVSNPLSNSALNYLLLGGEYRTQEGLYESGLFIGLGAYKLNGSTSETSIGAALGVTGDFELTRKWTVLVELTGHVTQLEAAKIFATGLAGLALHF